MRYDLYSASAGPHVSKFMSTYCRHSKGRWAGQQVEPEAWQDEILDEAFALDENGDRVYRVVLVGIPRKNGKSTLAAGVGLYMLAADGEPGPEVIVAAGSRDQANIVFEQACDYVGADATLQDYLDAQRFVIRLRRGKGVLKRIAADGKLQHGLNPSAIIFDELHAVQTPRQVELWAAMATSTGAREQPLTFIITTAGDANSETLKALYDAALNSPSASIERRPGLTICRDPEAGFLMVWYGVDETQHPDLDLSVEDSWLPLALACNPASWVNAKVLRQLRKSPDISEGDFKRLHLNMWTATKDSWLPSGCWAGLARPALARSSGLWLPDGAAVWAGVDIGITNDTTGIALASMMDHENDEGKPVVGLAARSWAARADVLAHEYVDGGRFRLSIAEDFLRDVAERYALRGVVYDPRFFEASAQALDAEGLTVVPIEQASAAMARAYQEFYQAAREGRIEHDGDPVFAAHVGNAAGKMTERGWKVEKLPSARGTRKIDALIAAVLAHVYAAIPETPSIYETRGPLIF